MKKKNRKKNKKTQIGNFKRKLSKRSTNLSTKLKIKTLNNRKKTYSKKPEMPQMRNQEK